MLDLLEMMAIVFVGGGLLCDGPLRDEMVVDVVVELGERLMMVCGVVDGSCRWAV